MKNNIMGNLTSNKLTNIIKEIPPHIHPNDQSIHLSTHILKYRFSLFWKVELPGSFCCMKLKEKRFGIFIHVIKLTYLIALWWFFSVVWWKNNILLLQVLLVLSNCGECGAHEMNFLHKQILHFFEKNKFYIKHLPINLNAISFVYIYFSWLKFLK